MEFEGQLVYGLFELFILFLLFLHQELNFLFFGEELVDFVEGARQVLEFIVPLGLHLDLLGDDVEEV